MLHTEARNERTTHIDTMTAHEMVAIMQEEYRLATDAVEPELPAIASEFISNRKVISGKRTFSMLM